MTIRIGIYDFFAQLIGGSFFLTAIFYLLQKMLPLPINILTITTTQLVILGVIAYVIGYATSRLANFWYRLWAPKHLYRITIEKLTQELIERMNFEVQKMDWYTLLAFIKRHNLDMAQDVVQFHAVSLMLRSTSFSLFIFAIIFCFEFLLVDRLIGYIFLSVLCLFLSIILIQEAVRYNTYFYRGIYQSVVALIVKPEQLSINFKSESSHQENLKKDHLDSVTQRVEETQ